MLLCFRLVHFGCDPSIYITLTKCACLMAQLCGNAALNVGHNPFCSQAIKTKEQTGGQGRRRCKDTSFSFALHSSGCGKLGINYVKRQKTL